MKDEGVTESQVYSYESPHKSSTVEKNSRDLNLFTFPISLSSLCEVFFARDFFPFCGRKFEAINKPHRKGKKQINFFSIYNAHCLIELDPIRSQKKNATKEALKLMFSFIETQIPSFNSFSFFSITFRLLSSN